MKRTGVARKSRVQKSEEIREALFQAAAEVVGECGYAEASISRITQRADLAQGTFYNYFTSRQEIFDELLPVLGAKMMAHIRQQANGAVGYREKEERSFRAFFSFLKRMPYFLRILNEAEFFAPVAHRQHFHNISSGYTRFMKKARAAGEITAVSDEEIEALVYMLIAARGYLALRYMKPDGSVELPEEAVTAYMRLLSHGLVSPQGGDVPVDPSQEREPR
ncbi:TetR/AcrR family transcriptional regulator [Azospirillum sp.]|uniref:TetR/AcrR family transcriptional regulator n=1 Tax=Azospirillum sp. TaxID=34012 RepID=UPI002D2A7777|nr:TetR/AcrR family transcriptional regulator [Azospirillum sp.]HYD71141.1 TetR/AcrR family transcriptional regulator [Azospirillum sp.]HYH23218.1 TetR/AcrR family transcriptional regulator [Azospirillum sp.]